MNSETGLKTQEDPSIVVEPILICYHCGSEKVIYKHCKVFCARCNQLVENCGGD